MIDKPAFPQYQPHPDPFSHGMTLRQYAAIKLKVPDSGTDWLDDMIRKSNEIDMMILTSPQQSNTQIVGAKAAAAERERITAMLMYLHNQTSAYHNYYKHAAIEINRKDGEGEKI